MGTPIPTPKRQPSGAAGAVARSLPAVLEAVADPALLLKDAAVACPPGKIRVSALETSVRLDPACSCLGAYKLTHDWGSESISFYLELRW